LLGAVKRLAFAIRITRPGRRIWVVQTSIRRQQWQSRRALALACDAARTGVS